MSILEERRARTQGTTKIAPNTEPAPMELNRIPQPAAVSFSSFRPTTGISAGISAIKKANKMFWYVRYAPGIQVELARNIFFAFFIALIPALTPVFVLKELKLQPAGCGIRFSSF